MKKILLLAIVVCVCVFALVSCVENEQTPSTTNPNVSDEPPVHVHTWVIDAAVESTCTEKGLSEGKHCSDCGEVLTEQKETPLAPHTEEVIPAVESTCTQNGLTEGKKCSVCDVVIVEQSKAPLNAHIQEVVPAVDATCTKTGLTEGKICSYCKVVLVEQKEIPIIAHIYDDKYDESCNECGFIRDAECAHIESIVVEGYPATCTSTGLTDAYECTKCGEILVNHTVIDIAPHTEVIDEERYEGCLGYWSEGSHCGVCGLVLVPQVHYPTGHVEGEWIIDIEPTTKEIGYKHTECIYCGLIIETRTIDKLVSQGLWIEYSFGYDYINGWDVSGYFVYDIGECTDTYVVIPETYEGEPIIGINYSAFSGCTEITGIEIPASVGVIHPEAFDGCTSLESIVVHEDNPYYQSKDGCLYTKRLDSLLYYPSGKQETSFDIPDYVVNLHSSAFMGNTTLENITIGKKISNIDSNIFSDFYSLRNIHVDNDNPYYQSIDGNLYSKDGKTLICYVSGKSDSSFTVPSSVTTIGKYAFANATSITSITLPQSLVSIKDCAFINCTSLESITIPNSVNSIGYSAFSDCTALKNVTFPNSNVNVESSVFSGCTSLESIVIPDSWTYIAYGMFSYCTSLKNVTIPNSVTEIESYAFSYCTSLESITIPNSVTEIGSDAFSYCTSLESITIPNSVTVMGSYVFSYCTLLKNVKLSNSLTSINNYTFEYCESLETIEISESITSVSSSAFDGCTKFKFNEYNNGLYLGNKDNPYLLFVKLKDENVTSCEIHQDTKMVAAGAFSYNTSLTSVTVGNSVIEISDDMFRGCSSLKKITFGSSIKRIGRDAFYDCKSITSIVVPDSVTDIDYYAFQNCTSLESVTLGAGVSISSVYSAFDGCYSLSSVNIHENNPYYKSIDGNIYSKDGKTLIRYMPGKRDSHFDVPKDVTEIGANAFENCHISSIKLPKNLGSIGSYAFKGCTSLYSIEIPKEVMYIGEYAFQDCFYISIYCETDSQPYGWDWKWNYSVNENDYIAPGIYAEVELQTYWSCYIWYEDEWY